MPAPRVVTPTAITSGVPSAVTSATAISLACSPPDGSLNVLTELPCTADTWRGTPNPPLGACRYTAMRFKESTTGVLLGTPVADGGVADGLGVGPLVAGTPVAVAVGDTGAVAVNDAPEGEGE